MKIKVKTTNCTAMLVNTEKKAIIDVDFSFNGNLTEKKAFKVIEGMYKNSDYKVIKIESLEYNNYTKEIEANVFYKLAVKETDYDKRIYGEYYAKRSVTLTTVMVYVADLNDMSVSTETRDLIDIKDSEITKSLKKVFEYYKEDNLYYIKHEIINKTDNMFLLPYSEITGLTF